jgi:outer membrane protein assembly factor BamB
MLRLLLVPALLAGEPAQWCQFRGPNGSGVSLEDRRLPVHFGPSKNVVWKTALPSGHSSPCLWGDRIFLTSLTESERKLETLCLDRQDGKILWRCPAPAEKIEKVHTVSSPAAPTPATDGQRVYVYFGSFGLLCYDLDGKLQWQKPLPFPEAEFGTGTSPIVAGDLVILNHQGPGLPLLAVRRETGETAWTQADVGIGYSLPIVWRHDAGQELIVQSKNKLTSFNLDGTKRWSADDLPMDAYTTGVIGEGLLFVNYTTPGGEPQDRPLEPFDKALEKYDKNKDGLLSREELPKDLVFIDRGLGNPGTAGGDITLQSFFARIAGDDGKIDRPEWDRLKQPRAKAESALWAIRPGAKQNLDEAHRTQVTKRGLPEVPSPLYYRGNLYLFRRPGIATCLEARTGKQFYQKRLPVAGGYYSSPIAGDGKVYIAAENGTLMVLAAGNALKLLAENKLGERIMATPAIADGTLYVRTEGNLYAFRE